jgi:cell division protein FtsQ
LRQIGSGQTFWWRASQSPTPSVAPWPVLRATPAKPRRPLVNPPRRLRRKLGWVLSPIAVVLAGATGVLVLAGSGAARPTAPALAEIERMIELAGYGLTQVSLTGHRLTPDSDIFDAIDLAGAPTMLSFDSRAAQARIEALSWVERASIERVFPDRLEVRIVERTPFAVWRLGARHFLIDRTGRVLAPVAPTTAPSLPRLAGEGAPTEAAQLYALLTGHPTLMRQVEVAERIGQRRWTLRLAGGGVIQLPADGVAEALARATALAGTAREAALNELDLRVPDRTLVREEHGGGRVAEHALDARIATGGI